MAFFPVFSCSSCASLEKDSDLNLCLQKLLFTNCYKVLPLLFNSNLLIKNILSVRKKQFPSICVLKHEKTKQMLVAFNKEHAYALKKLLAYFCDANI